MPKDSFCANVFYAAEVLFTSLLVVRYRKSCSYANWCQAILRGHQKNFNRLDHCEFRKIEMTLVSGSSSNGQRSTMNYQQGQYAWAYAKSMISWGKMFDNNSLLISYKEVADWNTFHGYDLTHHLGSGADVGLIKTCNLSVDVKFFEALWET